MYGIGDAVAAWLTDGFTMHRLLGMVLVGGFIYGLEIPLYFKWIDSKTADLSKFNRNMIRTLLAIAYFNPLWVARHLWLVIVFQTAADGFDALFGSVGRLFEGEGRALILLAWQSFLYALPVVLIANFVIQNRIPLTYRFLVSAVFSCCMAIFYPLVAYLT